MMESDLPPGSCNSTGHLSTIGYHTLPGRMHHSASTPAGVDGAGGGSRTPPATPKKGGKMLAVRVQMLDDSISMFQIQSKALGRVLFEQVCRQLHLLEADYFGLEYQDTNNTRYWLDVEKPMCRQLGLTMLEPTLRFCVKFYTPDPARLEEEFTRYLFCLQVKRDLAQGCIQCNENTAALMASYIVQAECGDFVPEDYPDHTYLSGYKFFPGQDSESERRIMENHKKHTGQSPAEADLNLLETARRCELYGVKMHPAKDHDNVPLNLAVAHMGIVVFQNFTKINTFSWAKIRKISFKRKKFLIKLHPEGYGAYRDVVEFFFEGRNECKNFWKKCVENHGFFRCTSVPRLPRHKTRVISRGSSFRYSGKTQKQIVEFVRDNYVKRQTFQRAGSFRASRSAGGSRASVAPPPLNTSVSAHPLLPLPPGSDAISLEWDKQPHYLEASLMMKGYSAEEARAAAERAAQRRTSEGATRPPLAATAYATTRDKGAPELVTRVEVNHRPTADSPPPHQMTTPSGSPENTWNLRSSVASGRARAPTPPPRAPRPRPPPDEISPDETEENTISSASLCMSPTPAERTEAPLCASTPLVAKSGTVGALTNGHDAVDKASSDVINGNVNGEFENTISSASLCMSPTPAERTEAPLCASTPLVVKTNTINALTNGHDAVDKASSDVINGNVNVNIVSESTYSMDVLSGGESDAGDTLQRRNNNNNSISSNLTAAVRDGTIDAAKRRGADLTYFIAKELLMTERTYKRDLELVTVSWSRRVSSLAARGSASAEAAGALARACLALEPLALACGALLARLDRTLAAAHAPPHDELDNEEPEYRKIDELLLEYLSNTYDAYTQYTERVGTLVGLVESVRRVDAAARQECAAFEAQSPLPLACLLLRPPHRALRLYTVAAETRKLSSHSAIETMHSIPRRPPGELSMKNSEQARPQVTKMAANGKLYAAVGTAAAAQALDLAKRAGAAARSQLRHAENHAALCQLQRDIVGYDKLLVADREFVRLGCVYKHSTRGLQQRMLFLFSDMLVVASRAGGGHFRAHSAIPLHMLVLKHADLPHSFVLEGEDVQLLISTSNDQEYAGWTRAFDETITNAHENPTEIDTELTPYEHDMAEESSSAGGAGGGLAHVCWHRATSLARDQLHLAMRTQLSGYLLRKFKKSPGWQKLWVVFAQFALFFYKAWLDDAPLASLPLLGYGVSAPSAGDGIDKDFVFKLQFKNHVYFFRADSMFTYNRWVEVLQTSMVQSDHN